MITKEMIDWFEKRTKKHIDLVEKCAKILADELDLPELIDQVENHDASKYEEPEKTPYIYISWNYKMKDDGKEYEIPEDIDDNEATFHHITHNPHHPEYHAYYLEDVEDALNSEDRDGIPDEAIDAHNMPYLDICEMVADWCAMSLEKGNTPYEWAEKVLGKRWQFDDEQTETIYDLIDIIWDEVGEDNE